VVLAGLADDKLRFHIVCPHCHHGKDVSSKYLGQGVRCPKCSGQFVAEWAEAALQTTPPATDKTTRS